MGRSGTVNSTTTTTPSSGAPKWIKPRYLPKCRKLVRSMIMPMIGSVKASTRRATMKMVPATTGSSPITLVKKYIMNMVMNMKIRLLAMLPVANHQDCRVVASDCFFTAVSYLIVCYCMPCSYSTVTGHP